MDGGAPKGLPNELPACTGRSALKAMGEGADRGLNAVGHAGENVVNNYIAPPLDAIMNKPGAAGAVGLMVGAVAQAGIELAGEAALVGGAAVGAVDGFIRHGNSCDPAKLPPSKPPAP